MTNGVITADQFHIILAQSTKAFVSCFQLPPAISPNNLLSENMLFLFCCTLNKIPLLVFFWRIREVITILTINADDRKAWYFKEPVPVYSYRQYARISLTVGVPSRTSSATAIHSAVQWVDRIKFHQRVLARGK